MTALLRQHIELAKVISAIAVAISLTWAAGEYKASSDLDKYKQGLKIDMILANQKQIMAKDSARDVLIDTIYSRQNIRIPVFAQIQKDVKLLLSINNIKSTSVGYVSERRDKRGHLIIEKAKMN